MKKYNVVFCGTPDFALPSLDLLSQHSLINIISVVTMPDRKSLRGQQLRPPPVADFCKKHNINYFQTENINKEEELLQSFKNNDVDLIIVLAFAQFLSNEVLNIPKIGCFNIHTSLLPKYRGASPIQHAILNNENETGVSIQKMVKEMDAGDVVLVDSTPIYPFETGGLLSTRLKFKAAEALSDFIFLVSKDKLTYTPQDQNLISYARTLKKEDGKVLFEENKMIPILNQIRAFSPWPGTFTFLDSGKRLKILRAEPYRNFQLQPGEINVLQGKLLVGCRDGTLRLTDIQMEGKKATTDTSFLCGFQGRALHFQK